MAEKKSGNLNPASKTALPEERKPDKTAPQASVIDEGLVGEETVFFTWKAPVRPFKKRDRDYYTTIASIALLIVIILFFLREFLLIAVVIALAFVSYVLAAVPPEETEHKLTNRGIRTANKLYRWGELQRYWFSEKYGQKMINVQTAMVFPGQLLLLLGSAKEKMVKEIINERLPYDQPDPTFLDKSATWLSDKVPLERESSAVSSKSSS